LAAIGRREGVEPATDLPNLPFSNKWGGTLVTYVIAEPCVDIKDKACVEECPVDCIYEGLRMLYIHPDECVDCGACEPVCPVDSISYEEDLPAEFSQYLQINAAFFADLGSPGGAAKVGVTENDPDAVKSLRSGSTHQG